MNPEFFKRQIFILNKYLVKKNVKINFVYMKKKTESKLYSGIEKILPLLLGIFLVLISITKINGEDDLYWHMETGKYIIDNKVVPSADVFSFATYGEEWIPFEWIWDVMAFLIYSSAGFTGLYILTVIILLLIFYLLFSVLKKFELNTTLSVLFLFILALGIKYRIGLKPHMFTYLFFVLTLYLIINYKYFGSNRKSLFLIPVIFLFWANIHMGVLSGLLIVFIYILSETFAYSGKSKKIIKPDKKSLYFLYFILLLAVIAMLVNPHFIQTYIYSVEHTRMKLIDEIYEWRSPFDSLYFGKLFIFIYIFFLIAIVYVIKFSFRKKDYFPALLCIIFAVYSLQAVRFTTDFLLITSVFVILAINDSFRNRFITYFEKSKKVTVSLTLLLIVLFILLTPSNTTFRIIGFNSDFGTGLYEETFPVKIFDFMKQTGITETGERPFQTFEYGGYFLYNFPGKKHFIDSRNLNDSIYFNFRKIITKSKDFTYLLKKYDFDYFIIFYPLLSNDPQFMNNTIVSYLSTNPEWKLIYIDNKSFLFVRNENKFQDIINKYEYKYFSPYNLFFKKQELDKSFRENNEAVMNEINRLKTNEPESFYLPALSRLYQKNF